METTADEKLDKKSNECPDLATLKLFPNGNRALVEDLEMPPETSEGGIVMPGAVKREYAAGTVLALGNAVMGVDWLAGDVIVFSRFAGTSFEVGRRRLRLIDVEDVLAVARKE